MSPRVTVRGSLCQNKHGEWLAQFSSQYDKRTITHVSNEEQERLVYFQSDLRWNKPE